MPWDSQLLELSQVASSSIEMGVAGEGVEVAMVEGGVKMEIY